MASLFHCVLMLSLFTAVSAIDNRFSTTFSAAAAPPAFTFLQNDESELLKPPQFSPFAAITPILTELGYHHLAMGAHSLSLSLTSSVVIPWLGPMTVFAPADSSVRTCPSCSISLLLQEHTVPGLYPLDYLQKLAFGTKIETILAGRCLTLTSTANSSKIFIGGAEVTQPDLYNNGHVIVHGLQGYVSHLSPYSCSVDRMASLAIPTTQQQSPTSSLTRMMLADVMIRLRTRGYSILALALRVKYPELVNLHNMTIFALDDAAIFHGGSAYVHDVKFHIVPNWFLRHADLAVLPAMTVLPTLLPRETLTVTSGGGGEMSPMRINYVRMERPDLLYNMRIVVHGVGMPFQHLHYQQTARAVEPGRSGLNRMGSQEDVAVPLVGQAKTAPPSPVVEATTLEIEYHHGL